MASSCRRHVARAERCGLSLSRSVQRLSPSALVGELRDPNSRGVTRRVAGFLLCVFFCLPSLTRHDLSTMYHLRCDHTRHCNPLGIILENKTSNYFPTNCTSKRELNQIVKKDVRRSNTTPYRARCTRNIVSRVAAKNVTFVTIVHHSRATMSHSHSLWSDLPPFSSSAAHFSSSLSFSQ